MEALDGLIQLAHTSEGAFIVVAQIVPQGARPALRISLTDGRTAWYQTDVSQAAWADLWRAAGDASEEAYAKRVQHGFQEGMLDPVRTGDSQTMCVRVDSLSTTAKVIEFRLSKVSEKERADQLQALLVMMANGCQQRGSRIDAGGASHDAVRRYEAEIASLRQQLDQAHSSSQAAQSPLRPPSPHREARIGAVPIVKRKKGHSIVNPRVKRSKAKGAQFSDDDEDGEMD